MMLFFGNTVFALCGDCSPGNCEDCGCIANNTNTACVYSNYVVSNLSCGDGYITDIPKSLPKVISIVYNILQVAVPVVLVVFGSIDLVKGLVAQKEDEIKKGQKILVKRIITGAIVYFVFAAVKIFISIAADNAGTDILECAECFIENKCDVQAIST